MSEGPGCRHDLCLFERDCLVVQAEHELAEAQRDRAYREERGAVLALASGLTLDEGPLFEVAVYSSDRRARIRAAEILALQLEAMADAKVIPTKFGFAAVDGAIAPSTKAQMA